MIVSRPFVAIIAAACAYGGAARAEVRGQGGMTAIGSEIIAACAPTVAAPTVQQIIDVESNGNPLAISVNGANLSFQPQDAGDAATIARSYIQAGYTVDMGLMQVNSTNLSRLGYSVEDMFDACKNLRAGSTVLTNFYKLAVTQYPGNPQAALQAALSAYNTGSFTAGFANGYVARYFGGTPASGPVQIARTPAPNSNKGGAAAMPLNPYTVATVVFVRHKEKTPMNREKTQPVISRNEADSTTPGVQVEHTAASAERNGAFEESAMSEADAWHSNSDLAPDPNATGIMVGGKRVTSVKDVTHEQ